MATCAECGFLATRTSKGRLAEVTETDRQYGRRWPLCAIQKADLREDVKKRIPTEREEIVASGDIQVRMEVHRPGQPPEISYRSDDYLLASAAQSAATKWVLSLPRPDCERDGFVKWWPGFSPQEHREMLDRQWMLDREENLARENRRWRRYEFGAVIVGLVLVVAAAFIEQCGQPTVIVNLPSPSMPSTATPGPTVAP